MQEQRAMRQGWWRAGEGLIPLQRLGPLAAALMLAAVAALVLVGLRLSPSSGGPTATGDGSDRALYIAVVEDVRRGEPYDAAAMRELRARHFPVRPFLAVRPPLLAEALAQLPSTAARQAALAVLTVTTLLAWAIRLRGLYPRQPLRVALGLALLASGASLGLAAAAWPFHETWTSLLIALSLALWRPGLGRAWPAVALGLVAALLRELALPFLAAMCALAAVEGRRGEALVWMAALGVAGLALAAHARAVLPLVHPGDLASPGWLALGGWRFLLSAADWSLLLAGRPPWVGALALPVALAAAALWPAGADGLGRRVGVVVLGYAAGFCLLGRPDNSYWGVLIAPLWPLALVEADRAAAALRLRLLPPRPHAQARLPSE